MSNSQVTKSPREMRFGYAEQTTYGTAELDTVAFTQVDCEPIVVNRDVKIIEGPSMTGSRNQHENSIIVVAKELLPTFTTEMVIKKLELADLLAAFFQEVAEGATTPFDKSFTLHDTQPDFLSDAGFFYTWIARDPVASKSVKVADCILRALTITIPGAAEPARLSAEWIGRGVAEVASNPSGTWTPNGPAGLYYRSDLARVTIDFGSGDVNFRLVEAEIALSRTVVGVGQDSGQFAVVHLGEPKHTFKIKVVHDDDWSSVHANQLAGTAIDFNIGWGNATPGTDDGDFDIEGHGIIDGPAGQETEYDEPMTGTISGTLVMTSTDEPITIVMADAVDHSW